jgi:hypothetical protein
VKAGFTASACPAASYTTVLTGDWSKRVAQLRGHRVALARGQPGGEPRGRRRAR